MTVIPLRTTIPTRLPATLVAILASAVLAMGCGAGDNPTGSAGLTTTVDTLDGVIQVMNRGAPPVWSLTELLTLGSAGGDGAEAADDEFGRLTGVIADREGLIYVADVQSSDIRVFGIERG